jgi:2-oxoisovalerate dehydrogenase E1 component beta subunit
LASIADEDPVIFMEPKRVYRAARGEVPESAYTIPLGEANIVREGDDATLIAYGAMVHTALEAAKSAQDDHGLEIEVIDVRSLVPLDIDTLTNSAKKTGRVVIVHEAPKTCGFGAELLAAIQEDAFWHLEAPIVRVTGLDTPFPHTLEDEYLPNADRVLQALIRVTED